MQLHLSVLYIFTEDAWLVLSTDMHAPHNHSVSTRNHMQLGTDPLLPSSLHLFPFSPGELVFGSFYFPEVCPLFPSLPCFLCDTSVNICGEEGRWGGERQRQLFTVARRRVSCSFSAARVTLVMPPRACGARLSQPSSARILHGPCASGEPPLWVKGEVEWGEKTRQGEGRPLKHYMTRWWSEVGYFFSLSHGVQSEQSHPLSNAPSWWQSAGSKQVPTHSRQVSTLLFGGVLQPTCVGHNEMWYFY